MGRRSSRQDELLLQVENMWSDHSDCSCPFREIHMLKTVDKCVCLLPDHDSVMNGDRSSLGVVFCDTPSTMCDGTNSFWCESGGTCNEVVQGENYTCACALGFSGVHCQDRGLVCGDSFCFNAPDVNNPVFDNKHHGGEPLGNRRASNKEVGAWGALYSAGTKRGQRTYRGRGFRSYGKVQMVECPDFSDDGEDDPFADTPKVASAYKLGP
ncbi:hypothetical protein R1sor_025483 [Riccia sorocarpa]|uniref:EGF-like domain-containing protein n=1 Tax=Riccia sorocarpa TaxID=122646 RepID=A0ABD3GC05_9MARC